MDNQFQLDLLFLIQAESVFNTHEVIKMSLSGFPLIEAESGYFINLRFTFFFI